MSIEEDIDNPEASQIFSRYPAIMKSKELLDYITDYLRIISSGNMATHELEGMMENEIDSRNHELEEPSHAVNKIADALPGLGIVAAVLGIVITMNFMSEGPERIGLSVAAALVGTFMGIFLGYGFIGPISIAMEHSAKYEIKAYECVKSAIVATVSGQAPQMAIEFGRKALPSDKRPGFQELNDHVRSK
jgi:chemotaxis protein MotA